MRFASGEQWTIRAGGGAGRDDAGVAEHEAVVVEIGGGLRTYTVDGVPLVDGGTVRLPRLIGHSFALDLILTGRGVSGEEALRMGLANRLVDPGRARDEAVALAKGLARLPQRCLRSDRLSSYRQWDLPFERAMDEELRLGLEVIRSGETRDGARRFAAGAGRHGASD